MSPGSWRHLVTDLRDAHWCVAPDLLGMGLSGHSSTPLPRLLAGYQIAALDDLVRHLVDEHRAPDRGWTVVAHDWGGPIALAWACLNAEKVDRVVVLNTAVLRFPEQGLPPGGSVCCGCVPSAPWRSTTPRPGPTEPPGWG
ncbi:alpha/beta fold hydrolase [Streptomyces syringium]|uniref:alpha/beta fold hydrolase n=1 Tax=Streptomyces syringium TaxID=76729 RepID=UPI00341BADDA